MDGYGHGQTALPNPQHLLDQSERSLRLRDYFACRTYAVKALQSDPHLTAAEQILAVANILIAAHSTTPVCNPNSTKNPNPNFYSILQLASRTDDSKLIKQQFKKLLLLLHPVKHKWVFSSEAFSLIGKAWSVLSNPTKKAGFDLELEECYLNKHRHHRNLQEGGEEESFWTACPYCFCVYEYIRVYEGCCLRCQNCRKAFHGVAIPPPPPLLVVDGKDEYYCRLGVYPLGYLREVISVENNEWSNGSNGPVDNDVDDSFLKDLNFDKSEEEGKVHTDESDHVEVVMQPGIERKEETNVVANNKLKGRRKTVAKNTKKITGTGNRVQRIGEEMAIEGEGGEADECETGMNIGRGGVKRGEGGETDESKIGMNIGRGGVKRGKGGGFVVDGFQYYEGDDDLLVGIEIIDD